VSYRLKAAGIRCPTPVLLRLHVLVMEFIGTFLFCVCLFVHVFQDISTSICHEKDNLLYISKPSNYLPKVPLV